MLQRKYIVKCNIDSAHNNVTVHAVGGKFMKPLHSSLNWIFQISHHTQIINTFFREACSELLQSFFSILLSSAHSEHLGLSNACTALSFTATRTLTAHQRDGARMLSKLLLTQRMASSMIGLLNKYQDPGLTIITWVHYGYKKNTPESTSASTQLPSMIIRV